MSQQDLRTEVLAVAHVPSSDAGAWTGLCAEIKGLWRQGEPPDAHAAMARHPELAANKSVLLDLAYEEYCLRAESGQAPDPEEFCSSFPGMQVSLRRLIKAHDFLEDNSPLLGKDRPVRWPEAGEAFLGFSLVRELGRGSFARVFLAVEPALGNRSVVVKVSRQGGTEAETLGRLNHPNVVPVHSVQEDQRLGFTVVCMPYLGSATLCDVLDRTASGVGSSAHAAMILEVAQENAPIEEPPPERTKPDRIYRRGTYIDGVIHIGAQLAEALAYIHALGICHRDLKPSNVLMTPDGRPMLLDFNLSFDRQMANYKLGGTLPYMAPEQLEAVGKGRGAAVSLADARSDLFALGVMLYELLTSAHPFGPIPVKMSTGQLRDLLVERQKAGFRPLRQVNPAVGTAAARAVEQCLANDPQARPQSAAELATLLRKSLSPLQRVRRWIAARPLTSLAAAVMLLAVGIGGSYALAIPEMTRRNELQRGLNELQRGLEEFREGHYQQAVEHLTVAIEHGGGAEALFARGRAYQRLGDLNAALTDLESAYDKAPDGRKLAEIAYCLNRQGRHTEAIDKYREAIGAGYSTPEVYNNLGFSYVCGPRPIPTPADRVEAESCLHRALSLHPNLQAVYHNHAREELKRAGLNRDYLPIAGVRDVRKAIKIGPACPEVYINAARLAVLCAQREPVEGPARVAALVGNPAGNAHAAADLASLSRPAPKEIFDLLWSAWRCGANPKDLGQDYLFTSLKGSAEFQGIVKLAAASPHHQPCSKLLDPVTD